MPSMDRVPSARSRPSAIPALALPAPTTITRGVVEIDSASGSESKNRSMSGPGNAAWTAAFQIARASSRQLRKHVLHDFAVDVGQASSDAVVVVGQLLVVDAEQVQHRGVEVVPGDGMLGDLPADVVGGRGPFRVSSPHRPASRRRHTCCDRGPGRPAFRRLREWRATELRGEEHERVVEHAALSGRVRVPRRADRSASPRRRGFPSRSRGRPNSFAENRRSGRRCRSARSARRVRAVAGPGGSAPQSAVSGRRGRTAIVFSLSFDRSATAGTASCIFAASS